MLDKCATIIFVLFIAACGRLEAHSEVTSAQTPLRIELYHVDTSSIDDFMMALAYPGESSLPEVWVGISPIGGNCDSWKPLGKVTGYLGGLSDTLIILDAGDKIDIKFIGQSTWTGSTGNVLDLDRMSDQDYILGVSLCIDRNRGV